MVRGVEEEPASNAGRSGQLENEPVVLLPLLHRGPQILAVEVQSRGDGEAAGRATRLMPASRRLEASPETLAVVAMEGEGA